MPIAAQSRGFWIIREVFSLQLDFYRPKGSTCFDGVAVALGSWTRDQHGFRRIRKPNLSRNEKGQANFTWPAPIFQFTRC